MNISRVIIYPTDACNLDCKYCFVKKDQNLFLAWSNQLREVIDILWQSDFDYKEIEFLWWEPLLNFSLMQSIIEYAAKYPDIRVVTYTNGVLLTDTIITFFRKHSVRVNLSLDGERSYHELERVGWANSYDMIIRNLERYVQINEGKYPLGKITVSPNTMKGLFENIVHLIRIGFTDIYFDIAKGEPWTGEHYALFQKIFQKLYIFQKKLWSKVSVWNIREIEKRLWNNTLDWLGWCRLGESLTVWYDGNLYACQTAIELWEKEKAVFFLGSLNDVNLKEILIERFRWWTYPDKFHKSPLTEKTGMEKRLCFAYVYRKNIPDSAIDYRIKMEEYMAQYVLEQFSHY